MIKGIKKKDIDDFEKYARKLNEVMGRIRSYKPEAMAFLDNGDYFMLYADGDRYDYIAEHRGNTGLLNELDDITVTVVAMENGFASGAWG